MVARWIGDGEDGKMVGKGYKQKMGKFWDLRYSMVAVVNSTALHMLEGCYE